MRRILKAFIPSTGPLILSLLVLTGFSLSGLFFIALALSDSPTFFTAVADTGGIAALFLLPPTAFLFQLAALWERRMPAKALLACLGLLMILSGALLATLSVSFMEPERNLSTGIGVAAFCYTPLLLIFLPLPIYALIKTPGALRALRFANQTERAFDLIHAGGGEITYAELSRALDLSEQEVDQLLRQLLQEQRLVGYRAVKHGRFYTAPALVAKQERLLSSIQVQGKVTLDELARKIDVPKGLLVEWLQDLVRQRRFKGYLDWEVEVAYSAEAVKLRPGGRCDQCGGELTLVGLNMIRCANCGSQLFLKGETST